MTEEWEQCEKKLKDVRAWLDKARQSLDSPLNKKRPLRDQLSLREKMLGDVTIQKTKINMSVEKLQVHFRSGVTGAPDVVASSAELIEQLDHLLSEINQQSKTLEAAVIQLDQLQQVRAVALFPCSVRCSASRAPRDAAESRSPLVIVQLGDPGIARPGGTGGPAVAPRLESGLFPARP